MEVKEYKEEKDFVMPPHFVKVRGWARRAERGELYGSKYIEPFKPDIDGLVQQGVDDKARKMVASQIQEHLVRKYSGTYTLPGFLEIQSYVSQSLKPKTNATATTKSSSLPEHYHKAVVAVMEEYDGQIKPAAVYNKIRKQFSNEPAVKHKAVEKKILSLVSSKKIQIGKKKQRMLIG